MELNRSEFQSGKKRCAVLYAVFVAYAQYIQYVGINISHMVAVFGAILVMYYLVELIYARNIDMTSTEHRIFLLFFLVTFTTGLIGSVSLNDHLSTWMNAFEYFLILSCTLYIMYDENSIAAFLKLYGIFTIILAVTLIIRPVATTDSVKLDSIRYSISANLNSNILGMILALGCWCVLMLRILRPQHNILPIIGVSVLVVACMLTGSRKGLISMMIIAGMWFLWVELPKKSRNANEIIKKIFLIIAIIISFLYLYNKYYINSTMSIRMEEMFNGTDESNQVRTSLYSKALALFLKKPLIGWGFGGYGSYYLNNPSRYSHATYAELLACTGIIGCVIWGVLYIYSIIKTCYLLVITRGITKLNKTREILKMILILWLFVVFTSATVIYFYELNCFITLGILFSMIKYVENSMANIDLYEEI